MPNSKISTNGLEEQQRVQETKAPKTTTGPGETSVRTGSQNENGSSGNQQGGSDRNLNQPNESQSADQSVDQSKSEPGDLNEV